MQENDYFKDIPGSIRDCYFEGANKVGLGEFEDGKEILKNLIKENPDFVPAYNKLAVISLYQKDFSEAEKHLKKALEIDKEYVPAITNLGSLKREIGDRKKAREYYRKAIEIDPEYGPAHNNLGVIYREEGNYRESVKHLKKAGRLSSYYTRRQNEPFYKKTGCLISIVIFVIILVFLIWR